jgi:hypothetical protein
MQCFAHINIQHAPSVADVDIDVELPVEGGVEVASNRVGCRGGERVDEVGRLGCKAFGLMLKCLRRAFMLRGELEADGAAFMEGPSMPFE